MELGLSENYSRHRGGKGHGADLTWTEDAPRLIDTVQRVTITMDGALTPLFV
jgi:hypothetical protein